MPELPEVETVMKGLSPFLTGVKITDIDIHSPQLRIPIPQAEIKALQGIEILRLERRAKYILIHFANQKTMICHLGMTGSFTVFLPEKHHTIILDRHDHVVLTTNQNVKIVFRDPRRFGVLDVVDSNDVEHYKSFRGLGPEPLGDEFTAKVLKDKLKGRALAIKVALMDQKIVVGVGNIYASEALYLAGISPETVAYSLSLKKLELLVDKIKFILTKAIESGGSTLRDYRNVGGERGYFQFNFSVYDREGEPCPDCNCSLNKTGGIQRIVQSGRSTFFCKTRQK